MKSALLAGLAIAIASVYVTVAGVSEIIPQGIAFRTSQKILVVVPVLVNDQGPFDFVLDTGCDFTIVDTSLARKLELIPSGEIRQTSVAGQRTVTASAVRGLVLGAVQTGNLSVHVEDLGFLSHADPRIQGLLGQDVLTRFNYLLDYSAHVLRIESDNELRDSLRGTQVFIEPRHDLIRDKMIVVADAQSSRHRSSLRLVVDSGANAMVVMKDAWARLQVSAQQEEWEQTPAGTVEVHVGPIHSLKLGSEELHELMAASSSQTASPFADGLLPTSLFQSVYVNNRDNFVMFNSKIGEAPRRR